MALLPALAWRNLGRNRRRTVITVLAVAFATLFAVAMRGVQLGTYEENIAFALRLFPGAVQVQARGYLENPTLFKSFMPSPALLAAVRANPAIYGYAPRVCADGLVGAGGTSLGAALFGIDPRLEAGVTTFTGRVHEGYFFEGDSSGEVVLGFRLLENLKASVGDSVVILSQGYDGTLGNRRYRVAGTVKTGSDVFDGSSVFLGLGTLQDLLGIGDRVHVLALAVPDLADVDDAVASLASSVDTSSIVVLPWRAVVPDLEQVIELDNVSGMIFLGILIVVVAFGILNTVLMSVTERFREFGVLLSLGMPQGKLVRIVFLETMFITLIGLAAGNLLALGTNYYLMTHPIEFTGEYGKILAEYGFLPMMRSTVSGTSFLNTSLAVLGISLIATIYPLYRTWRLEPLRGIRYT